MYDFIRRLQLKIEFGYIAFFSIVQPTPTFLICLNIYFVCPIGIWKCINRLKVTPYTIYFFKLLGLIHDSDNIKFRVSNFDF